MATRVERLLAAFDKIFSRHHDRSTPGSNGAAYSETYWSGIGTKFCFVDKASNVSWLGNSFWVIHQYDENGVLLSRKRVVEMAGPDERIIYGHDQVYQAYRDQPNDQRFPRSPGTMTICY